MKIIGTKQTIPNGTRVLISRVCRLSGCYDCDSGYIKYGLSDESASCHPSQFLRHILATYAFKEACSPKDTKYPNAWIIHNINGVRYLYYNCIFFV